jgi:hypothetical protein
MTGSSLPSLTSIFHFRHHLLPVATSQIGAFMCTFALAELVLGLLHKIEKLVLFLVCIFPQIRAVEALDIEL